MPKLHKVQYIPTPLNKAFCVFIVSFAVYLFTNRFISSLTKKGYRRYSNIAICLAGCISFHPGYPSGSSVTHAPTTLTLSPSSGISIMLKSWSFGLISITSIPFDLSSSSSFRRYLYSSPTSKRYFKSPSCCRPSSFSIVPITSSHLDSKSYLPGS